jgi:hypothetical protein
MKLLSILFLITLPALVLSQKYKLNQRYPGYFINAKGDTIRGYILLINKLDNQIGGEYSNDAHAEKIRLFLMPDEVKGFKVQDRVYTSIEYGDPDPKSEHFLLALAEGELKLYEYFRLPKDMYVGTGTGERAATGNDEQYLQYEYVVVKSGKQFPLSSESSLLKNADELFTGAGDLLQKIKDKEKGYRYNDLPEIVTQYNERQK